jgi:hypothetical protein
MGRTAIYKVRKSSGGILHWRAGLVNREMRWVE